MKVGQPQIGPRARDGGSLLVTVGEVWRGIDVWGWEPPIRLETGSNKLAYIYLLKTDGVES